MAAHSRPLLKLLSEPRPAKKIRRRQGLTIARRTSSKRVGIVAAVSPPPGRPLDDEDIVATTLDRGVRSATAARHKFSPRITVRWQRNGSCPSCGETDETPWVPLGVEAVVATAYRQALGTRASTNLNFAAARLTSLRRASPPDSSAIFRCSGDVPIAGESCLRRRGRRRYRAPSSIGDPSIKDNAVTLHQDVLCLRWPSWLKILAEKQHFHRLYYRNHKGRA